MNWPRITVFVCPECHRYWAKSEGKQQFHCYGVGHLRHPRRDGEAIIYTPAGPRPPLRLVPPDPPDEAA